MKRILARGSIFLLIVLTNCITPFVPPDTPTYPRLVVDGIITDQPGPYSVKLMMTANTSTAIYSNVYPYNAHVYIQDDLGNKEELTETRGGFFETAPNGMRGIVGRSYHVIIVLQEGTRYESTPEKLKAVSPIESIRAIYQELPVGSATVGKFATYVQAQDSPESGDYYKWTWAHYSTRTFCANAMGPFGSVIPVKLFCCGPCWNIDTCESCINILSDRLVSGKKINQFLLDVPYDSRDPYYLAVQQSSLSEGAYKYWGTINTQINDVGGVFASPPATIRGNLFNVSNQEEQVLGYFGVSAISKKIVYIARDQVSQPPIPPIAEFTISQECFPCKEGYFRTPQKPEGWIE